MRVNRRPLLEIKPPSSPCLGHLAVQVPKLPFGVGHCCRASRILHGKPNNANKW